MKNLSFRFNFETNHLHKSHPQLEPLGSAGVVTLHCIDGALVISNFRLTLFSSVQIGFFFSPI